MIRSISAHDTTTNTIHDSLGAGDLAGLLQAGNHVVWVDIFEPTTADIAFLADHFHFHPLALEDCIHAHQRPKVDAYDGYFFMVLYDAQFHVDHGLVQELDLFWGHNYVVTVHSKEIPDLAEARERWEAAHALGAYSSGFLMYLIVDTIVDNYFPVIEGISEQLEAIEEKIFTAFDKGAIQAVFALKKDLIQLRKVVVPLRDVFILLIRREVTLVDSQTLPYLQDVYDHLIRVADAIDTYRDLISSTIDAYLSQVANRTNEIMRRMTILSTVLLTPTLLAGIWGMNFAHMPELQWINGYPAALCLMLLVAFVELVIFHRLGYF